MIFDEQQFVLRGLVDAAGLRHSAEAPVAIGAGRSVTQTVRDLALIAIAWAILIGAIIYPAAQLIGLLTCAVALAVGSRRQVLAETDGGAVETRV